MTTIMPAHKDVIVEGLQAFRKANVTRCVQSFHAPASWTPTDWMTAVAGEVGEAANLIKKVRRGDFTLEEARADIGRELADVITYMDLLAHICGIDLGTALVSKFNEVSARVNSNVVIDTE